MIPTLEWTLEGVSFLDQTRLPHEEIYILATDYKQVATVIRDMIVRGAMAIGVSGAMGVALGIDRSTAESIPALDAEVAEICEHLAATRPTAVNLFWGIAQVRDLYNNLARQNTPIPEIKTAVVALAKRLYDEDIANCKQLGANGAELLPTEGSVLTHCNAGALAACGYGSALGVIRAAVERGHRIDVLADETRPYLQGARLTAWELMKDNIPTTVLCDNMSGYLMSKGRVQAVIVGADRIAANGDTANKIGTYSVSILAKEHGIPFYVAAPFNTIDPHTKHGDDIPIEQRDRREVTHSNGKQMTPDGVGIENPAFDVTPAKYITAIITERGVLRAPFTDSIAAMAAASCRVTQSARAATLAPELPAADRREGSIHVVPQLVRADLRARRRISVNAVLPALLDWRKRSLARGNFLVMFSLALTMWLSDFPHNRANPLLLVPAAIASLGTFETARCMQKRWSFYHGGIILCLYADLMVMALVLFALVYPYLLR